MTDSEILPAPIPTDEGNAETDLVSAPIQQDEQQQSLGHYVWEVLQTLILAGLLIIVFRTFLFQNYIVEGNSMIPTLEPAQRLIVSRISYILGEPERGDVIVFQFPHEPNRDFVKRILGLPGETVAIENGVVFIDGEPIPREEYLDYTSPTSMAPLLLSDEEYFVMGDNRPGSSDSRSWGPLARRYIIGQAYLVYYPFAEFGILEHYTLEPEG